MSNSNVVSYTPPLTVVPFLTSEKFASFIVGPVGSTKTTAAIMRIVYKAKMMKVGRDGIRRSRCAWIRNSRPELLDTSIPSFLTWLPNGVAGTYEKTAMKFTIRFDDVECEVLFRGLDETESIRRLLSLELSFAVLDETREINPAIYDALTARLGRYPSLKDGGCVKDDGTRNDCLWGATNPPDFGSWWEEMFTDPPENTSVTFQPGGLSPEADWLEFLPDGYYDNIVQGKTQDWIDVYVNAEFGKSLSGQPVFRSFNRDYHTAKSALIYNRISENPLIIGMDTALHPAATICQLDPRGRLLIFESMHSADCGALRFVRETLKPALANRYPGAKALVIIDPAGMQRSQTDESTVADIMRKEGFAVRPARTNSIAARIAAVDAFLTRNVGDSAGMLIDPARNGELIKAFAGKYRYRTKQNGDTEDKPDKVRPWADLIDSTMYACLHADGGTTFGGTIGVRRREVKPVVAMGWT